MMMGLCIRTENWPHPLRDLNYNVELIEPTFTNSKGETVNPDLILTTKKYNHAIIFECKCKTIESNQMSKYSNILPSDLIEKGKANVPDPKNFSADICIASFEKGIKENSEIIKYKFPVILCEEGKIDKHNSNFNCIRLNQIFPVNLNKEHRPPVSFYPFSHEKEDERMFISYVLRTLVSRNLAGKHENTVEEILKDAHPYWKNIDQHHKKIFLRTAECILSDFSKGELKGILDKIREDKNVKYKINPLTTNSLKDKCEKIIERMSKEGNLKPYFPQTAS